MSSGESCSAGSPTTRHSRTPKLSSSGLTCGVRPSDASSWKPSPRHTHLRGARPVLAPHHNRLLQGTPVIGSDYAANRELITEGTGYVTDDFNAAKQAIMQTYDRQKAFEYGLSFPPPQSKRCFHVRTLSHFRRAQLFRSKHIVQGLFVKSVKWMTTLSDFDVYTNPQCLEGALLSEQ